MAITVCIIGIAHAISPGLVIASNPVDQLFFRKSLKRAIQRNNIRTFRETLQDLRRRQWLLVMGEDIENAAAHWRAAQANFAEQI